MIGALVVATLVGLGFGWIAARSEGIYFLMITLAFSVLVFYFFSQVTQLSGFGGVNNVDLPGILGNPESDPAPRYFVTLAVAVVVFIWLRALATRTAFGLGLQGVRDEPARMRALGFDVTLPPRCSRSASRRSSRPSPASCRSGTTAASRRGRSTSSRRSTS